MNIGISTSVIQRGKTGIAQYLFALLKAFCGYTNEHTFVLFVLEEDLPLFDFLQGKMKIVVVPEKFRPPIKNIAWHQFQLPNLARQHDLDVLHIPSYRRLLWSQPCALVATIHDLAPFHLANKYDWKRMLYGRVVVKRLAHRQHEIIAISENTASDITRFFGIPRDQLTVIHNGLDHTRFYPGSKEDAKNLLAKKHGITSPFFLYIARLEHPAKNHVRLIEAFESFKKENHSNWKLVFGGSDWHGADVIHQKIMNSSCADDIHPLGFISDQDLPTLYRAADVFVYPSLYEGFGMPPIEAMACGCPVISSDRGSLAEIADTGAVLIDPENTGQMKRELAAMAKSESAREAIRCAGLSRARFFNWEIAAEKTLSTYLRAAVAVKTAKENAGRRLFVISSPNHHDSNIGETIKRTSG